MMTHFTSFCHCKRYVVHCEDYLGLGGLDEALVEVVRAHRVGQLAEVHLQQRGHAVDVLKDNY